MINTRNLVFGSPYFGDYDILHMIQGFSQQSNRSNFAIAAFTLRRVSFLAETAEKRTAKVAIVFIVTSRDS